MVLKLLMSSTKKKIIISSIIILLLLASLLNFSFLFPKKMHVIDYTRLQSQSKLTKIISNFMVGETYYDNQNQEIEGPTDITLNETKKYTSQLQAGDIIFTNSRRYLGSTFIEGKWKHTIIYIGTREKLVEQFGEESEIYKSINTYYVTGNEELILDSSLDGVHVHEFKKISNLESTSVLQSLISFRINATVEEKTIFLKQGLSHVGKKYDFDLHF